jgi:hypothetical protein
MTGAPCPNFAEFPYAVHEAIPLRENGCPSDNPRQPIGQERPEPMRLTIKQTECAGKMFWIVQDTDPAWFYHGPFADEAAAHAFARPKKQRRLESVAPRGADEPKGRSRAMKSRRGPVMAGVPACP